MADRPMLRRRLVTRVEKVEKITKKKVKEPRIRYANPEEFKIVEQWISENKDFLLALKNF